MKHGQISIQFNWIFILIVGGIILLFFGSVIKTQTSLSKSKIATTILNDLDAISTGAEVSRGTIQVINIPNLDLGFRCSETCSCTYSLSNIQVPYGDKILFSPNQIKGSRMLAWTFDWSMPFRVTNLVYMTSPEVKYVLLDTTADDFPDELFDSLPPRIMEIEESEELIYNKQLQDVNNVDRVEKEGNYKTRFIAFDDSYQFNQGIPTNYLDVADTAVTALRVRGNKEKGTLTFFKKVDDDWIPESNELPYIGESMLYAAIFSENKEIYQCGIERIFEKMQYVTDVYRLKNDDLIANSNPNCAVLHQGVEDILVNDPKNIKGLVTDILNTPLENNKDNFNNLNDLAFTPSTGLNDKNKALTTSTDGCIEIY
jgi:hypothetical protein